MLDRSLSALVAVSLAFLVWLYVRTRDQEILDNVPVPVQVLLAPGQEEHYELEVSGPGQIPASFTGPPSRMRELRSLLQRGELRVTASVSVPADRAEDSRYLETLCIEADDIHPPAGVKAVVLEGRNRIPVILYRLVERRLPVRLEHTAEKRLSQVQIEPSTVLVRGPQEVLDNARSLPTQLYVLPVQSEFATAPEMLSAQSVALAQELDGRRIRTTPRSVRVRVVLQPPKKIYEVMDVPVRFLCPPNFVVRAFFRDERAGKISLRLLGPAGQEPPTDIIAFIDLSGHEGRAGVYEEPVRVRLPKDFELAPGSPRLVTYQLAIRELDASKDEDSQDR